MFSLIISFPKYTCIFCDFRNMFKGKTTIYKYGVNLAGVKTSKIGMSNHVHLEETKYDRHYLAPIHHKYYLK